MQQRCRVHELDACRQRDVMAARVAAHGGRSQREHRPQPFAATVDQMAGNFRDEFHIGTAFCEDQPVDQLHICLHQIHQWLDAGRFAGFCPPACFFQRYDYA